MPVSPLTLGDAPRLVDVLDALGYPTTPAQCHRRVARLLDHPDQEAWAAHDPSGLLVGLATGALHWWMHFDAPIAELSVLAVLPGHSGRGHGKVLLGAFERWAGSQGAGRLKVVSGAGRDHAHRFYERAGYVRDGFRFTKDCEEG